MRLGILGGTFDPPHVGHLIAAQDACEGLGLDRLILVPAAVQPLKQPGATPPLIRLEMVRAAVEGESRFEVSTVELERGGVSFTVDTLEHFATRNASDERFFLVGADVLDTFAQWREPGRVVALARLVVLEREGGHRGLPAGIPSASVQFLRSRRVDVSSTEIRERVRAGKSIRGFVTDGVAAVIERERLYR